MRELQRAIEELQLDKTSVEELGLDEAKATIAAVEARSVRSRSTGWWWTLRSATND